MNGLTWGGCYTLETCDEKERILLLVGVALVVVIGGLILRTRQPASADGDAAPTTTVTQLPGYPSPNAYEMLLQAADNT
ncbi:MAG: hypothetical protein M2R45_02433 [Verrucomicrobia subdivision 3 bacterium]|nr:hypothetical protein [Limisphaerales bacterium]MCS1416362.1 hypothetical protein [Limisphaerales bacterium]